jgi:RNA polymerase sigma-70 factor, ECF subfamily
LSASDQSRRFESLALPHLAAAFNLARWLTRNDDDARDVVQEAFLRAYRYFDGFRGSDCRPWLLAIVRREFYTWAAGRHVALALPDDDELVDGAQHEATADPASADPEALLLRRAERAAVNRALAALPVPYREVLILREIEDLDYRQIAEIVDVPIGTVMSRLSRARAAFHALMLREDAP